MMSLQTMTIFLVLLTATTVPAIRFERSSDASTTALNSDSFRWIQYYSTDLTRDACNAKYYHASMVQSSGNLTECADTCDSLDWCTSFMYCHGNCTLPTATEGRCELRGTGCSNNSYSVAACAEDGWCNYIANGVYDPRLTMAEDTRSDEHRDDDRDVRSDEHRDDDRDVRSDEHRDDDRDVRSDEHRDDDRDVRSDEHRDDDRDVRSDEHRDDDRDVRSDEHRNVFDPRSPEHIPVVDAPASATYDPRDQIIISADYDPRDNYTQAADYDPRDQTVHGDDANYDPRDPTVHGDDANYDPRDTSIMAADYDPRDFSNFTL